MRFRIKSILLVAAAALALVNTAQGDVVVKDVATLQGEHVNRLMGYGLVVGLNGTGDAGASPRTLRSLEALHRRYEQNISAFDELANDENVGAVMVEVETPRHGWAVGERVDVIVSALGAESLRGGALLATPLQVSPMPANAPPQMQRVFAIAGGAIEIIDPAIPTRGRIRGGAVMELEGRFTFIHDNAFTLVLRDELAGFDMANMLARNINAEIANPAVGGIYERDASGGLVVNQQVAEALGPKRVRVRLPSYEQAQPDFFISRVLNTKLFDMPKQQARVVINRRTHQITLTGSVTILPTVVQIPGLGTVSAGEAGAASGVAGVATDPERRETVEFQELLNTLSQLQAPPEQMVAVVEQLAEAGALQAQVIYTE